MEAVNGNRFGRWLGEPTRAGSSDRGSGSERVMVSWVRRASSSLGPSASPGNMSLSVSEGHATPCNWSSSNQLNFYGHLSFWPWTAPFLFSEPLFFYFFLSLPRTSYGLELGPNKCSHNLIFLTCVLLTILRQWSLLSYNLSTSIYVF